MNYLRRPECQGQRKSRPKKKGERKRNGNGQESNGENRGEAFEMVWARQKNGRKSKAEENIKLTTDTKIRRGYPEDWSKETGKAMGKRNLED